MRSVALLAAIAVVAAPVALADGPTPLELDVGEAANVCTRKLATCPVQTSICDDPKIARVELGKAGPEIKGVSPGTTLCGILGSGGFRRMLRVTVKVPEAPSPKKP